MLVIGIRTPQEIALHPGVHLQLGRSSWWDFKQTHKHICTEKVGLCLPDGLGSCTDIAGKLKHLLMDLEIK